MANISYRNPVLIDTVGLVKAFPMNILGVSINASNNSWAVKLIGTGASSYATIVDLSSAVTGDRGGYFPIEVNIEGIQADTLTNITSVLVYEKASR